MTLRRVHQLRVIPPPLSVIFEVDGGSAIAPLKVAKGSKITRPKDPTKQGHRFAGWYTDPKFSKLFDFKTQTITENITLYAQWKKEPSASGGTSLIVTFAVNGGSAVAPLRVAKGSKIARPTDPSKPGHHFAGWYTDPKFSKVFDFKTQTSHREYYAVRPVEEETARALPRHCQNRKAPEQS